MISKSVCAAAGLTMLAVSGCSGTYSGDARGQQATVNPPSVTTGDRDDDSAPTTGSGLHCAPGPGFDACEMERTSRVQ